MKVQFVRDGQGKTVDVHVDDSLIGALEWQRQTHVWRMSDDLCCYVYYDLGHRHFIESWETLGEGMNDVFKLVNGGMVMDDGSITVNKGDGDMKQVTTQRNSENVIRVHVDGAYVGALIWAPGQVWALDGDLYNYIYDLGRHDYVETWKTLDEAEKHVFKLINM